MQVSRPAILVDDDEDDQEFIRDILRNLHIKIELKTFIDGAAFLAYLKTTSDLPLLNLSSISMHPSIRGDERTDQNDNCLLEALPSKYAIEEVRNLWN